MNQEPIMHEYKEPTEEIFCWGDGESLQYHAYKDNWAAVLDKAGPLFLTKLGRCSWQRNAMPGENWKLVHGM